MKIKKYAEDDSFAGAEAAFTAELQSLYRYACYRLGEREAAKDIIRKTRRTQLLQQENLPRWDM